MPKKILVTGAAGFIGFHVAKALAARGDHVLGYDNFNPYYSVSLKEQRAEQLAPLGVKVIRGEICDREGLLSAARPFAPTHCLHLAAEAGIRYGLDHPNLFVHSNLDGFISILELCRTLNLPLLYASSSSVYGNNKKIPYAVEDPTDAPFSLYGATKKCNELLAHAYHQCFGFPCTALRYFTVYGPWSRPDMATWLFADRILAGEPITLFNHGKMERDFTHIDDIVQGTLLALDHGAPFEVFNLGSGTTIPLGGLVDLLEHNLGREAIRKLAPMPAGEVVATCADNSKAEQLLGYRPQVDIESGIGDFSDWLVEYRERQRAAPV
ncbi:MAG: NAD-dependent epimerase/dehydratase family protein [Parachlamydiales bacterium]